MRRQIILAAFCVGTAGMALAQVGAPQLGWVPDGTRIRSVHGIPASAAAGDPVATDQEFSRIAASPAGNYVLVSSGPTSAQPGSVSIYTPASGFIPLEGAGIAPDLLILSPRGSSAALWFFSINQVQLVTGMPSAPAIRQVDAAFLGAPGALALSDDGAWFAGVWSGGVYAFGPNGEVNRMPLESVTTLAFFAGTHDLAAAGPGGVQKVTGIEGFAVASNLLTSADASLQPVAIAAASNNRTVLLADHNGSITAVDVASGAATTSGCACTPEGLFGMGPTAFRLTGMEGGSFKLFDTASGEILFAPLAFHETTEGAGQ